LQLHILLLSHLTAQLEARTLGPLPEGDSLGFSPLKYKDVEDWQVLRDSSMEECNTMRFMECQFTSKWQKYILSRCRNRADSTGHPKPQLGRLRRLQEEYDLPDTWDPAYIGVFSALHDPIAGEVAFLPPTLIGRRRCI